MLRLSENIPFLASSFCLKSPLLLNVLSLEVKVFPPKLSIASELCFAFWVMERLTSDSSSSSFVFYSDSTLELTTEEAELRFSTIIFPRLRF
jgi:hypothetical protein